MIDLHMHTNYSDGTDSVIELLKNAENNKLELIAITDHDTCDAYEKLENIDISKYYTGKIVKGVELTCFMDGEKVEILGYNMDIKPVNAWLKEFYKDKSFGKLQLKYFNILYEMFTKKGAKLRPIDEIIWNPEVDWSNWVIRDELNRFPENKLILPVDMLENQRRFTRRYVGNSESEFYIDKSCDYPKAEDVIKLVKDSRWFMFFSTFVCV